MNLDELAGLVKQRPQVAAAGVGLVGVVALVAARNKHRAAAGGASTSAGTAAGDAAAVAAQTAGLSGTPNTSAVDDANAFQDVLNQLGRRIDDLSGPSTPAPPADKQRFLRFLDSADPKAVYLVENGQAKWLTSGQWSAFVKNGATLEVGSVLDTIWSVVQPVQAPANDRRPGTLPKAPTPPPRHSPNEHPKAAPPPPGVRPQTATYTLRPGESLHDAAAAVYGPDRAGAMASAIAAHNSVRTTVTASGRNVAHTYPGQQLRLP